MSNQTEETPKPPAVVVASATPAPTAGPEPIRYDWNNTPYGTIRLWVSWRRAMPEHLTAFLCRVCCWGGADKYELEDYISFEFGKEFAPVIDTILQRVFGLTRQPAEEWMGGR